MKITLGSKEMKTSKLMEEGLYMGEVEFVQEGEKAKVGSELLDTIIFGLKINYEGSTQQKQKKMILTDRKDSELSVLLKEFDHLVDGEGGSIDLMDFIGEKCNVEIVRNLSQRGNMFANVGKITSVEELEELEELEEGVASYVK